MVNVRRNAIFLAMQSALCLTSLAMPAHAQQSTAQDKAYTLTVMCSVVAAYYGNDADILRTADAVRKMQRALRYDNKRVAADSSQMAGALGVERRRNPNAMEQHRASCRKLGLVS